MRRIVTLFLFVLALHTVHAQCPGCQINFSCTVTPAYPTLCPVQPPDATAGEPYQSDVTFWMPDNFTDPGTGFNVDFVQMTITGVTGLPFGLQLTTNDPLGIYYPQQSQYGCARICGTPLGAGTYTIAINIIAQVIYNGFTLNVPQSFGITLVVQPGSGGNASFTFSPSTGCGSANVQFNALINGSPAPTTYAWDLGNGTTSNSPTPAQNFTQPGTYPVTLTTTIGGYVLTDVVLSGVTDNWCGDVEEPSLFGACTGDPDLYFVLTDGNGNAYTSSSGSNSSSQTWNGVNQLLAAAPYSIAFFDEDVISQDDDLGTFNIPVGSSGNLPFVLGNGTFGSLTITVQPQQVFTDTDTVRVFPAPQLSTTYDTTAATICAADTGLLVYTWFNDGDTVPGFTGPCVDADSTGAWWGVATNGFGCTAVSDTIVICPAVTIQQSGLVLFVQGDFTSYAWSLDGQLLPGADGPFLVAGNGGLYSITVTTDLGCVLTAEYQLLILGAAPITTEPALSVYPSPNTGQFTLALPPGTFHQADVSVIDPTGRLCWSNARISGPSLRIELAHAAPGRYAVLVRSSGQVLAAPFVVE